MVFSCFFRAMELYIVTLLVFTGIPTIDCTTPIAPSEVDPDQPPAWQEVSVDQGNQRNLETCFVTHRADGKAYLIGGILSTNTNVYDPATQTWDNSLAAPPVTLTHMQCLSIGDSIWIPMAWTGPSNTFAENTEFIYIYHPANNTWSTKPGLTEERQRGAGAAVYREETHEIYVSHGNRGGHGPHSQALNFLDRFDLQTGTWEALVDAPNARDHCGGGMIGASQFCVAGGRDSGFKGEWFNSFFGVKPNYENAVILPTDCYDFDSGTWTQRADIPQGRGGSGYATSCDDSKLIVAGGEGFSQAWSNVEAFDGTSWEAWPDMEQPRHGTGIAVSCECDQWHTAGGASDQGGTSNSISHTETLFPNGQNVKCTAS